MRAIVLSGVLMFWAAWVGAFEVEDRAVFGPGTAGDTIRVISTADIAYFEPMIRSFLDHAPGLRVDYTVASSSELMKAIRDEGQSFDLAISSAMDLQTKLANDGLARPHFSDVTRGLPGWAKWNDMVFAFTQEPAAMVLSRDAFADLPIPRSRQDLIRILRQHPDRFRGRIGTYDVRVSGLGYLFATQDTRASETFWRLTEVMGALEAKLYCCSSEMINDVERGDLAIAYNVLSSYAATRADTERFHIVLPQDFTTVMLRSLLIPVTARNRDGAARLADHILSQGLGPDGSPLAGVDLTALQAESTLHRIRLGPGLLVFLDQFKKRSFLAEWQSAIVQ